eukprot:Phypoly_transcript_16854.p1 GENE.Phypoly_transcript_16854~~Phypoly_transcript_16854.p1  ORF type:complete len:255 (+),score=10.78 Phypoly_transcript_16854:86-766(+)
MKLLHECEILCIDKVSQRHIEAVIRGTGSTPIGNLTTPLTASHLGYIDSLQIKHISGKQYIFIKVSKEHISSIVICAPDSHTLHTVQEGIQTGISILETLLHDPYVVPGAGCLELFLILFLRYRVSQMLHTKQLINMEQVISAFESGISTLDPTTPKESIIDKLITCNKINMDLLLQTQDKQLDFYGWNPHTHSPFVSFQHPCSSFSNTNYEMDFFVVDSLALKLH